MWAKHIFLKLTDKKYDYFPHVIKVNSEYQSFPFKCLWTINGKT
jgi:hypothetical protein